MKFVRSAFLLLTLSACATTIWTRPNTTAKQSKQDAAECRIDAYGKHPYKELVVEREHSAPTTEDANDMLRDSEASYCMRAKGYSSHSRVNLP